MIELGDVEETYEVAVTVLVPVKRLIRVKATSDSHARVIAAEQVRKEVAAGEDHEWSIPQCSRDDVPSDQHLLGGLHQIHHSALQGQPVTGMCPTVIRD